LNAPTAPPPGSDRRPPSAVRAAVALAVLGALVAGLPVVLGPGDLIFPDAMEYADMARGLARGDGLLDRAVWPYQLSFSAEAPAPAVRRAPGFPWGQALVFKGFGPSDRAARAAGAFFFWLCGGLVFLLVLRLGRAGVPLPGGAASAPQVAFIASFLVLFDPGLLLYGTAGLSEPLFTAALLVIALALTADPFPGRWMLAGFLAGSSQLIRLNGFTLIASILAAAWPAGEGVRWRRLLAVLIGAAPPLGWLALRNHSAVGDLSFLGPNGAIVFNELGGLPPHGIERRMFLPPASPPTWAWVFEGRLDEFLLKAWRGLEKNLSAAAMGASPLAAGASLFYGAARWPSMPAPVRALWILLTVSGAVWIGLFAVGEFEGPRFFTPLAPLALVLTLIACCDMCGTDGLRARGSRLGLGFVLLALTLPGVFRLAQLLERPREPSFGRVLGSLLEQSTPAEAVILADVPWAVAWFGDRTAVWLPLRVDEVEALRERAGATHLLLTPATASDGEIEPRWREIYFGERQPPSNWRALAGLDFGGSIHLFSLGP